MKATTLADVYRAFDPQKPLKGNELKEFYIKRETPIKKMMNELLNSTDKPLTILFAGTRGNGKTTELNRLIENERISENMEVISFSVKDELDVMNIEHTDILLIIGKRIYQTFEKHDEIEIQESLMKELDDWSETIIESVKEQQKGIEIGGGVKALFINLAGKFKSQATTREISRKIIEPRLSDLISIINKMIFDIESKLNKKILVVIDDLDKMSPGPAEDLFFSYVKTLIAPKCHIIYTLPVHILTSKNYSQIQRFFDSDHKLPNINLTTKEGKSIKKNHTLLKNLAYKRIEKSLITREALTTTVRGSGGLFHDFVRNLRKAANEADTRNKERITKEDVRIVEQDLINDFSRIIDENDKMVLREVSKSKSKTNGDVFRNLLFNLTILEYGNGGLWYDVHPAVKKLIE